MLQGGVTTDFRCFLLFFPLFRGALQPLFDFGEARRGVAVRRELLDLCGQLLQLLRILALNALVLIIATTREHE